MQTPHYENKAFPWIRIEAEDDGTEEGQRAARIYKDLLQQATPNHPKGRPSWKAPIVARVTITMYPPDQEPGQEGETCQV